MKLWYLAPRDPDSGPWDPWYDKCFAMVVRADSEEQARQIAQNCGADEVRRHADCWLNQVLSSCEELTIDGVAGCIIQDISEA